MMRVSRLPARAIAAALLAVLAAPSILHAQAPGEYAVTGMVVSVNRVQRTMTVSHQAIPGVMNAMTMPFEVRRTSELDGLEPGTVVTFTLKVDRSAAYAEGVRIVRFENVEQDPFNASRLKMLRDLAARGASSTRMVAVGEVVPDFRLIDQQRRPVSLSQLRGKVVVVNFVYTTCALPNFCLRLANHFGVLQKRFERQLGHDLVLLTLTFDPIHDTPDVLAKYASQWKANADTWRFLTGPQEDVERACALFGVHAFSNEGLLDHSLHTAVIDRGGRLVANIEGNQFTAAQLGDLTDSVLRSSR
jgi:protein SCO1